MDKYSRLVDEDIYYPLDDVSADEQKQPPKGNAVTRWFRKTLGEGILPHGGMMASGFNLASATLGAGSLALPSAFAGAGGILCTLFLLIVFLSTVYSITLLMITFEKTGCKTYEQMSNKLVGKWFERVTIALIILFCWGIDIVYVVAMGDILSPLQGIDAIPNLFKGPWGKRLIVTLFWIIFMFPLSLAKEINTLRYASVFGMSATIILAVSVIVHAAKNNSPISNVPMAVFDLNMVLSLPIVIFSYCCQTNSFEIYTELKNKSVRKMTITSAISMGACTIIYIVMGMAGCANFGAETQGNILKNFKNPTSEAYICVAFVAIAFTLTMAFPICVFPSRDAILQLIGFKDAYTTPAHIRVPVAGMLSISALILGLFVPGISVMFGLLGGICGSTLSFMWPGIFIIRTKEWTREKVGTANIVATWLLIIFGLISGILGTTASIYVQFR